STASNAFSRQRKPLNRQKRKVTSMNADSRRTWALDREIVLSRVIAAPRERVFQAWSDPKQITQWFGPDGFKIESLECDIRAGGGRGLRFYRTAGHPQAKPH